MDDSSQSEPEQGTPVAQTPTPQPEIRETISFEMDEAGQADTDAVPSPSINVRAYQKEMLSRSLEENVIVAMDTGSGKTQVAILRIQAELEKSSPGKIIWFLAPTVSLCAQQHNAVARQVRSAKMKLLTGNDKVDTWKSHTWDAILDGVHVVISTFQVLLDALAHAFVKMDRLSLLIFDEAHNCVRKHPGRKVMTDFYQTAKETGSCVPSILGLTASPSMRSHAKDLETLESTLDARCISPTVHRDELIKHVSRPQLLHVEYSTPDDVFCSSSMRSLQRVYNSLDVKRDPYVLSLLRNPTDRNLRRVEKAIEKKQTYSQEQLKGLASRARELSATLGSWAADRFLYKAVTTYLAKLAESRGTGEQWVNEEKRYLARALEAVAVEQPPDSPREYPMLSEKASLLVQKLLAVEDNVWGIVFVKERAAVTMLKEVLQTFPAVRQRFRIGVMVGESNFAGRKSDVYDFVAEMDAEVLQKFRSGTINLLIATSVLEEGIDVPACNLVVCFDQPATSKSFIQRRGRARMHESQHILFFEKGKNTLEQWLSLEEEMKQLYQDEQREAHRLAELEQAEGAGQSFFTVESTGARLDFDNAKQGLEHFCQVLSQGSFVDNRPDYIIHKEPGEDPRQPKLGCTVILPPFLPPEVRKARSASVWLSEKNATRDAAFQAYRALYKAGFVNDNLLPFERKDFAGSRVRDGIVTADEQLNPWVEVDYLWTQNGPRWVYEVSHRDTDGTEISDYQILLPIKVTLPDPIRLYIDHDVTNEIRFTSVRQTTDDEARNFRDDTSTLLSLHYGHRWPVEDRNHVIKVMALELKPRKSQIGASSFEAAEENARSGLYLVRGLYNRPYLLDSIIPSKPAVEEVHRPFQDYKEAPEDVPYLALRSWTRRSDFLHPLKEDEGRKTASDKRYRRVLPSTWAKVDEIPAKFASFGMLIPQIIHELELMLVTERLMNTILEPLQLGDHRLVREAMSSRSAGRPLDYQRFELLGDSILKYCTAVQLFAEYPGWHEGYLSSKKDSIVSNTSLCEASMQFRLGQFILTKNFTGHRWRPLYLSRPTREELTSLATRQMSTKTLADVVESLIGAAFVDGAMDGDMEEAAGKALQCMSIFLPRVQWQDMRRHRASIFERATANVELPSDLASVEDLLGYSFRKKSLLIEALTHASYVGNTQHRSLERLEFLGDAVLDYIVVTKIFSAKPALPNSQMHLLKTAMVNAEYLGFISMQHGITRKDAVVTDDGQVESKNERLALWQFMRHGSSEVGIEQEACLGRYESLRGDIVAALGHGERYPWGLLARLRPSKFYSDMVEALLGAVWIDSGSLAVCEAVLDGLGIMPCLQRMIRDKVHMKHAKEELGVLAGNKTVTYEIYVQPKAGDEAEGVEYSCSILVGERAVAHAHGGATREEAKIMAAEEAVRILTEEE